MRLFSFKEKERSPLHQKTIFKLIIAVSLKQIFILKQYNIYISIIE